MNSQHDAALEKRPERTCFIVFSSRESYLPKTLELLSDFLLHEQQFFPLLLDESRVPGKLLLPQLIDRIRAADLGIVFLDGLRPNVALELGMLLALATPTILLKGREATINFRSLLDDLNAKPAATRNPRIDVSKHVSDISNISWNEFNPADPAGFIRMLRSELDKLKAEITIRFQRKLGHDPADEVHRRLRVQFKRLASATKVPAAQFSRLVRTTLVAARGLPARDRAHAIFHIALEYFHRDEFARALEFISQGMAADSNYIQLHQLRILSLLSIGQIGEALQIARKANARYPNRDSILEAFLTALFANKKHREALSILSRLGMEQVLTRGLESFVIIAHAALENYREMMNVCRLSFSAGLKTVTMNRLIHLITAEPTPGKMHSEKEKIQQLLLDGIRSKCKPCWPCLVQASVILGMKESAKEALAAQQRAGASKGPDGANLLAFNYIQVGMYREAMAILGPALKRHPKHSYINATMGLLQFRSRGQLESGDQLYKRALKLRPQDVALQRMYHYQRALLLFELARISDAKREIQIARRISDPIMESEIQALESRISRK